VNSLNLREELEKYQSLGDTWELVKRAVLETASGRRVGLSWDG
jgi:hypothetical protein